MLVPEKIDSEKTTVKKTVIGDGPPAVDYHHDFAWLDYQESVVLTLPLTAKHACVYSSSSSEGVASVVLGMAGDGGTLHADNPESDSLLEISFPNYIDWECLHAFVSRYTLFVVLVKNDQTSAV